MKTAVIIVAAGRGTRAGGALPKQWRMVAGRSVAEWSVRAFAQNPRISQVVLVVSDDSDPHFWPVESFPELLVAYGGETRAASVLAGLEVLEGTDATHVLIHDVARPAVPPAVIDRVIDALQTNPAAAPALQVTDALWRGAHSVDGPVPRDGLWRAQTPQGFKLTEILAAHRASDGTAADDVEVARAAGLEVTIVQGHEDNMKITGPDDFARAETLLGGQMDIRLGNGYDVHRFGDGDHVWLCGVKVPHDRSLQGHSDADVGMHAVTDAIYGALSMGDIGQHFPPSDPQWKGAASHIFLEHACALAREHGFTISNADCTLVCEHPKIGPHAADMKTKMSEIMGMDADRISVKATTSERLGFTGRGEGIAALATATLVKT